MAGLLDSHGVQTQPSLYASTGTWYGSNLDSVIDDGSRNDRFHDESRVFVYETDQNAKATMRSIDDTGLLAKKPGENRTEQCKPEAGVNRMVFIQYWIPEGKDIPLAEKRKLHVTKEMFSALCERFKIPAYYVETLLRPNQLGRLGAATGLFPGPDHRPEIWEISYRYTAILNDRNGNLDLNWELNYIYTRYHIETCSSFTLCISPHHNAMKLWTGYDINHKLFPSEASHALKGIRSIGESRAVPDARNPLAYHLLLTQQSLEDWKGWVENKREGLLHFEEGSRKTSSRDSDRRSSWYSFLPSFKEPDWFKPTTASRRTAGVDAVEMEGFPAPQKVGMGGTRQAGANQTRSNRLGELHLLKQRFTIGEGSVKDIQNRVTLLTNALQHLRSIPRKDLEWQGGREEDSGALGARREPRRIGVAPSTLDRDQQELENLRYSCHHSEGWTDKYTERSGILIGKDNNALTSSIAMEANRDGADMTAIQFVAMIFLPATFVCVIGAGVVGLAVARGLALRSSGAVVLLERHRAVGTETSSRNSEVIHAGIYYGPGSLKTSLCIRGKTLLYRFCESRGVPHQRVGKWIVAQTPAEREALEALHAFCRDEIDVPTNWVAQDEAKRAEPDIRADAGVLESPTTGIIDSHDFMTCLLADFEDAGGVLSLKSKAIGIRHIQSGGGPGSAGWEVTFRDHEEKETTFSTETVVNSAGLAADYIHNLVLPPERHIRLHYAKGNYFSYISSTPKVRRLIYPTPRAGYGGLGTHLTIDLAGRIRFGPDVDWVDTPHDLKVNPKRLSEAAFEIKKYLPSVTEKSLVPDYAGIRPKFSKEAAMVHGKGFNDFVIRKEENLTGFINLLGIESPGLTSSLAIAETVENLLYR